MIKERFIHVIKQWNCLLSLVDRSGHRHFFHSLALVKLFLNQTIHIARKTICKHIKVTARKVIVKGGVWKNTEDEILKVAVMKYGKNQWARISSLLTRKTPKQCKARWYEWLDPSIRKVEWSKEEDEKLLHLAKLMPTQWRTIAPIVGRTAAQCLERYQKLLDDAQGEESLTGEDVRKLRPGEIDPDPETKPARPDPVDMDEDGMLIYAYRIEKEMLSEARARLANTMGKKAKRKARERQLEEAKRMASILKRRDMTDTTITAKQRKKWRAQMDYNADIPFHKTVPVGFHDISEEMEKEDFERRTLIADSLAREAKRKLQQEEADNQQGDQNKQKQAKTSDDVSAAALKAIKEAEEMSMMARKKLVLPAPQMSDAELQEILKIGKTGSAAKSLVESAASSSQDFSKGLLAEYDTSLGTSSFRTPMQPASEDNLKMQARNLRAMTESQTPLLGDSVSLEGNIEFKGATPKNVVLATPNPMSVHLTPKVQAETGNFTPRIQGSSISKTPLRDQMGINQAGSSRSEFGDDSSVAGTPRAPSGSQHQAIIRSQLKSLFSELPKPKNDFEVVLPDRPSKQSKDGVMVDDAEAVMMREEAARLEEEAKEFRKRSSAVQKDLPRPSVISVKKTNDFVQNLILEEAERMMQYDAVKFPYPGQRPVSFDIKSFQEYSEEELNAASALIDQELVQIEKTLKRIDFCAAIESEYESLYKEYLYVPKPKPRYVHLPSLSDEEKIDIYSILIENYRELIRQDSIMAQKQEQKANILFGGYIAKCEAYAKQIVELYRDLEDAEIEYNSFAMLKQMEDEAIPLRLEKAKKEYDTVVLKNRDMQEKYATLKAAKESMH